MATQRPARSCAAATDTCVSSGAGIVNDSSSSGCACSLPAPVELPPAEDGPATGWYEMPAWSLQFNTGVELVAADMPADCTGADDSRGVILPNALVTIFLSVPASIQRS